MQLFHAWQIENLCEQWEKKSINSSCIYVSRFVIWWKILLDIWTIEIKKKRKKERKNCNCELVNFYPISNYVLFYFAFFFSLVFVFFFFATHLHINVYIDAYMCVCVHEALDYNKSLRHTYFEAWMYVCTCDDVVTNTNCLWCDRHL